MPTTHTWKGGNNTFIFDPTQYVDGAGFSPGDTLLVPNGMPSIASTSGNVVSLVTGTYNFATPSATVGFSTDNAALDAASTLSVVGAGKLEWTAFNQFVNNGVFQVGSPAGLGYADMVLSTVKPVTLTNQNSISVQTGSTLWLHPISVSAGLVNAAGATISVGSGSTLLTNSYYGYNSANLGDLNTVNNGVIDVTGAPNVTTKAEFEGSFSGSGLLSVRGVPGAAASTGAQIHGPASGTFDIASGELEFYTRPTGGSVNFEDGGGALFVNQGPGVSYSAPGNPFGATITGFRAGDVIDLTGALALSAPALSYNPATHLLVVGPAASPLAQFTLAGNYQSSDFQATVAGPSDFRITTTSNTQATPAFTYTDITTGAVASSPGQVYSGPLNNLQSEFIWAGTDGISLQAAVPNAFIKSGAGNDLLTASGGSNVLDGGAGSNFLTGATGADGGADSFFLDGRGGGTTWDTLVNFHHGDAATLWGFAAGTSAMSWTANDGAPGHQGATIHASLAGAGTPINASITFSGVSLADAQSKFALSTGGSGGQTYLYVKYTG